MRSKLVLLLLALWFPPAATSQSAAPAAQSKTPDSTNSYEDSPAADPARPTVTNPAHIPPPGYLQFEQGFLQANDSYGINHQSSVVQTTKISLNHYLMIVAGDQPYAHTLQPPGTNDTGDLTLGAQVLFNDEEEGHASRPTVALAYNGRVRSGTALNLDTGGYSQSVLILVSGTNFGLHYDTNYLFNEQDAVGAQGRNAHRAQYGQTLSVSRSVTQAFGLTLELWHFTQPTVFSTREGAPVARANAVGLLFTPSYNVRPNLVLDCGFEHGLTSSSTNWQGFVGFTYLLPHRLFKPRHSGKG